jgi:hypothetical protein
MGEDEPLRHAVQSDERRELGTLRLCVPTEALPRPAPDSPHEGGVVEQDLVGVSVRELGRALSSVAARPQ